MKRSLRLLCLLLALAVFAAMAIASTSDEEDATQGEGSAENTSLGDYEVEIMSCRLASDYEGKPVVIVKYKFTNNSDESQSFMVAFDDEVYQDGVGLNGAYVLAESANYDSGNQTKEIKTGTSLEVEVAYELNDTTTDVEVEVSELISFNDKTISKTFKIAE